MTTERLRSPPTRSIAESNLKLYLIALLAMAYVLAWWLFGGRAPERSGAARVLERSPEPLAQQQAATWYQDLPPSERPVVHLPVGWHIADRPASSLSPVVRDVPVPLHASPARAGRIRTRSS